MPALDAVQAAVAEGGFVAGFVGYEAAPAMDGALAVREPIPDLPLLWFGVFDVASEGDALAGLGGDDEGYDLSPLLPELEQAEYEECVRRALALIAAGDTYQVNLTFRMRGRLSGSPAALYRDLCLAQRSGYCAFLEAGDFAVLSASPELFFHRHGRAIELRPMKGTRPRGRWTAEDDALAVQLAASPKDRAENLMIVDLLRNDAGRIAEFGSVRVSDLYEIERYPTVHQMTSTVEATLRDGVGLPEIFRALFPSGSVTGAPKIRTSEIIRDLELSPRGPYAGALGFARGDTAVFSVAIRTLLLDRRDGSIQLGVGSGITADSVPEREYDECIGKSAFTHHGAPAFEVLESLRLEVPGGYPLLPLHLDRLADSARYFGFPFDRHAAEAKLRGLPAQLPPGTFKVRILVGPAGSLTLGYEAIPDRLPPATLRLADEPVDERDPFLYHKTTHREVYRRALARAPRFDDVVLFNRQGEITETATANLVLELEGELVTPPVSCGLLSGVLRRKLLEEGTIRERVLSRDDLDRATALHLINAVRGWREGILLAEAPDAVA
ncbi:MAG TPA: aminodeoxychorismate synthase component I [Longimicrobiaceae bacterium]|nr:aminodeoxychorismate synthase component I [Longimicrobiaceae bacterium]